MDDNNKNLEKFLKKVYFFLKFRPRTEKEITDYLNKKIKPSQIIVKKIIEKLQSQDLINDERFVIWFIEKRKKFKPKSRWLLTKELLRLGVSQDLIENYFENNPINDEALAIEALKNRWERFKNLSEDRKYQKTISFLTQRGFNFETAKKIYKKFLTNLN